MQCRTYSLFSICIDVFNGQLEGVAEQCVPNLKDILQSTAYITYLQITGPSFDPYMYVVHRNEVPGVGRGLRGLLGLRQARPPLRGEGGRLRLRVVPGMEQR